MDLEEICVDEIPKIGLGRKILATLAVGVAYLSSLVGCVSTNETKNTQPISSLTRFKLQIVYKKNLDYVEQMLKFKDKQGHPFLKKYLLDLAEKNVEADYVEQMLKFKDKQGDPIFGIFQIIDLYPLSIEIDYVKEMLKLKDKQGHSIFGSGNIKQLAIENITVDYVKNILHTLENEHPSYDFLTAHYLSFFHPDLETDFSFDENSNKPKCLYVLPANDWNGAFTSDDSRKFFRELKKEYDVKLIIADQERDVYNTIKNAKNQLCNIELLVLGGHGTEKSLSLKKQDLSYNDWTKDEAYNMDPSDNEIQKYLEMLDPDAVIFLNSCMNAEGGKENKNNLYNFIVKYAENRKVIASKESFSAEDISINKIYPLDLTIKSEENTVTNK